MHFDNTSVVIPINPYFDNITPICTIPELNRPWGIAVTDNKHIIVSEIRGHCVTVLDRDKKKLKLLARKVKEVEMSISLVLVV